MVRRFDTIASTAEAKVVCGVTIWTEVKEIASNPDLILNLKYKF